MKRLYVWYDVDFLPQQIIATSKSNARKQLLKQGKIPVKIRAEAYFRSNCFSQSELLIITKQLATLLKAELPIVESLTLLAKEHIKPHWQYLLNDIKLKITTGDPLSQVLSHYPDVFSLLFREMVATGELTGQLGNSFELISVQLEKSLHLKKRIKKALRYPLFLLMSTIIVALVMLLVVLPQFSAVYESFDAKLPYFTQCLIDFSNYLKLHGQMILIGCLFIGFAYHYVIKPKARKVIDYALIQLPILGLFVKTSCLTQIFQTLAITQQSSIPLLSGLTAAAKITHNSYYQESIKQIILSIEQGNAFSYALSPHSIFPPICFQLIHAGEESGSLDTMLDKLACYFQEKNDEITDNLTEQFEPILMAILSIIIGSMVIALYLPIFQLGEVIH